MTMADLEEAFRLIDANEDADFVGERSDHLIVQAEAALKHSFPPTYKTFLTRYGCGAIAGCEIYGVIKDDFVNSSIPDAIWLTLRERMSHAECEELILIAATGYGSYFAIDCEQSGEAGEHPIVEWWPGFPQSRDNPRKTANDFGEFLLQELRDSLEL